MICHLRNAFLGMIIPLLNYGPSTPILLEKQTRSKCHSYTIPLANMYPLSYSQASIKLLYVELYCLLKLKNYLSSSIHSTGSEILLIQLGSFSNNTV